jgi:hypothetical protein
LQGDAKDQLGSSLKEPGHDDLVRGFVSERNYDPLKIYYCIVLGPDDPEQVTTFQGFSPWWHQVHWALRLLPPLPADVLERTHAIGDVITHRMGGMRSLSWFPLNVNYLEQACLEELGVFFVCFSGAPPFASRVAAWAAAQPKPVLHVTPSQVAGACHPSDFNDARLYGYCRTAFEAASPELFSNEQRTAASEALARWTEPVIEPSGLTSNAHNITLPNYMVLDRCHLSLAPGKGFIAKTEREYSEVIVETAAAVLSIRQKIGLQPLHRLSLLRPPLVLAEPALFRSAYARRIKPEARKKQRSVSRALRLLQKQKGLHSEITEDELNELKESPEAQAIIAARQSELETFTLGAGLHAAQTCSGVVRLSPGVNHVFPALSAYARNVRSEKFVAKLKAQRLFGSIQDGLLKAVGPERVALIDQVGGPIKIVSDAPIEWLPVRGLPLSLRYDCSRINATPGNLMMGCLTEPVTVTFQPADLTKILVLTAFAENDPLRTVLTRAVASQRSEWQNKADIVFKSVRTITEFIDTLNAFDG